MTAPHLDDEQLSALLDEGPDDPHLASCAPCSTRLDDLASAQQLLATPPLPLAAGALDAMIDRALEAFDHGRPVDLAARRLHRRPPPTWLLTAAAALAALVGVAGLVRASDGGRSSNDSLAASLDAETSAAGGTASGGAASGGTEGAGQALESAASAPMADLDPEVVGADLGEQSDPAALTAVLQSTAAGGASATTNFSARAAAGDAKAAAESDAPVVATPTARGIPAGESPPAAAAAPATTAPQDRARCRADAERIGAGRLGGLLSTSSVRWKGEPAEVLVFLLTEPAGGVTRQALVLSRPTCGLLADPRF